MAIYTASQATKAVQTYSQTQSATLLADTIARYQYVFDSISAVASTGGLQLVTKFSKSDYTQIAPVLVTNGYAITPLPQDDVSLSDTRVTYETTITWPLSGSSIPTLTGSLPTQFTALENLAYAVTFTPVGGLAPYTFTWSGSVPTGMTFGDLVQVNTLTLSGTPTNLSEGIIQLIVTDALGSSQTTSVSWAVNQYVPPNPTTLSQLTNDVGYIVLGQAQSLVDQLAIVAKTGSYSNLLDQPDLTQKANTAGATLTGTTLYDTSVSGYISFSGASGQVVGLDKTTVGLDQVDNTSDANKPVSSSQQAALDLKANLESPVFTGKPTLTSTISDQRAVLLNTSVVNNRLIVGTIQSGSLSAGMIITGSGIPSPKVILTSSVVSTGGFATITFYTQAGVPFAPGQVVTLSGLTGTAAQLNGDQTVYDATTSQIRFPSSATITLTAQAGFITSTQSVVLQARDNSGNWTLLLYQPFGLALSAAATTIVASPDTTQLVTKDYVDRKFFFHLAGGIW